MRTFDYKVTGLLVLAFLTAAAASRADEMATSLRFEQAKASEPEMIAFLRRMPKGGDLHNHVAGAVTTEVLMQSAINHHMYFDPTDCCFYSQNNSDSTRISSDKFAADQSMISKYLNKASMCGWNKAAESGHDHFFAAFPCIESSLTNTNVEIEDVVSNAIAENEQYLELMTNIAPTDAYEKLPPITDVSDLDKALATVRPALAEFAATSHRYLDARDEHLAKSFGTKTLATGVDDNINIRYIYETSRLQSNESFFRVLAAAFYCMEQDPRIVAINIVAPEDYEQSRLNFAKQMQILHYLHQTFPKGHITLHAGELTPLISPIKVMRSRIRKSIEEGDAERIGHGVSIAWEDNLPQLFEEMRSKGTAVEVCLTSNATILGVEGDRHPFNLYRKAGIPTCISTDDEGVSRGSLTLEYTRAARTYNLSYADLKSLARNGIEYSFLPGKSLYVDRTYAQLHPDFVHVRDPQWTPSPSAKRLLELSPKATKEVQLERAFVDFEE